MNLTVWAWVGLVILSVAPFVTYALGIHHGHAEGKHRRTCNDLEAELEARHDEWMARIRGPWDDLGPLQAPGGAMVPGEIPGHPLDEWGMKQRRPDHITAADIGPVVVPEPKLTDTGELRAIGERGAAIRAAMVTGELAWRAKSRLQ